MSNEQEIRDLFSKHQVPLSRSDVWDVKGNLVVKHRALERLGAAIGIDWNPPVVIRAERDEAVVLVSGMAGDLDHAYEWSIGEAAIGQNYIINPKAGAYPYAMAEKRGKDRVILKLAGLHGVYSEEEAEDFKAGPPEASEEQEAVRQPPPAKTNQRASNGATEGKVSKPSRQVYVDNSIDRIAGFDDVAALLSWALTEKNKVWPQYGIDPHGEDGQRIVKAYKARMEVLEREAA